MNWLLLIGGLFAAFATVGHFTIGSKSFLKPVLEASIDEVPKKVMHCVFHFVSAYQVLSSIALLGAGVGLIAKAGAGPLIGFIAINYAAFAVVQVIIAVTSKIENAMFKLFQWIFWVIIAVFAWLGMP